MVQTLSQFHNRLIVQVQHVLAKKTKTCYYQCNKKHQVLIANKVHYPMQGLIEVRLDIVQDPGGEELK